MKKVGVVPGKTKRDKGHRPSVNAASGGGHRKSALANFKDETIADGRAYFPPAARMRAAAESPEDIG